MRADDALQSSKTLVADPAALIKRFYGTSSPEISELVGDYSEAQRVDLAAYCYSRSHLYELGLAIAATCEIDALAGSLGLRGEHLYAQSRCNPPAIVLKPSKRFGITLAPSAGRIFPAQDFAEEDSLNE